MPAKVILNPYSNRWNARQRWPEAEAALRASGVEFSADISKYRGHDGELARQAALDGFSPIIVAGGDGTIGEVVNGLAGAWGESALGTIGIIPLGTANDLVCNLGLPLGIQEAVAVIAAGKKRRLDVCKAGERYFVNNSAVGLEPYISVIEKRIKLVKGMPRYLLAAIKGILLNPKWHAVVDWDDGHYEGPLTLLSVGNAPRTGGLFYMTPHADPLDGKLTVVLAFKKSSLSLLALLPKTLSPAGKFIYAKGIREFNTTRLHIRLEPLSPAHCDGELFLHEVEQLEYSILPARLNVLVT